MLWTQKGKCLSELCKSDDQSVHWKAMVFDNTIYEGV